MDKTCPQCGTVNSDESRFCGNCGAALPDKPSQAQQESIKIPKALVIGGVQLPIETVVLVILMVIQAILSFELSTQWSSSVSYVTSDGLFSSTIYPIFVVGGLLELGVAFALFRKLDGAVLAAFVTAVSTIAIWWAETVVSVLMILLIIYTHRADLSKTLRKSVSTK